jgi:acyl-CoA thioester hydrolase
VRDYECDIQHVVNNAVYQQYLEHARHEFLQESAINFAQLTEEGINLVVIRAEIDYKSSLKSGDEFWVGSKIQKVSRVRFCFLQDIYRQSDNCLMVQGKIIGTALNHKGRPFEYGGIVTMMDQWR